MSGPTIAWDLASLWRGFVVMRRPGNIDVDVLFAHISMTWYGSMIDMFHLCKVYEIGD